MSKIKILIKDSPADARVILVVNKNFDHKFIGADVGALHAVGYKGEGTYFHQATKTLFYGIDALGEDAVKNAEILREAGYKIVKFFRTLPFGAENFKNFSIAQYGGAAAMEAFALGALLGAYDFNRYKTKKTELFLREIFVTGAAFCEHSLGFGPENIRTAEILAESICDVRDAVNTPPQEATPEFLAQWAQHVAKDYGLSVKILNKEDIAREKMACVEAVGRASVHESRVIHLSYVPSDPKKRVVLVGKGLTYDCGGLSLKPADYMTTMKADKSGGCAVIGAMKAIARLAPDIEVHGIVGAVENMIGGNAYKPDDVLISREGVTIEVKNTDAEGRLVLADCLSYSQDLAPDFLIDFATLTGACVVALGEYTSGVMGHNDMLKRIFRDMAQQSGELATVLDFNRHLDKLLKSEVADVSNIASSRYGSAITAGMFLSRFIREENKQKWLHIDIAGPAYVEKEWDVNPYGASGIGVRAAVNFVMNLKFCPK